MNRRWLSLLLLLLLPGIATQAQTHEILRPRAESDLDSTSVGCGGIHSVSTAMPNAWDAAGLTTSSDQSVNAAGGAHPTAFYRARQFTNWGSSTNSYGSLTLFINSAIVVDSNNNGAGAMAFSENGGTSWIPFAPAVSPWTQTTFSATIPANQDLTKLRVAICVDAAGELGGPGGTADMTVFDTWTDGTFSVPTPTPTPTPAVPVKPAVPSPVIVSRLWIALLIFLLVPVALRRRE